MAETIKVVCRFRGGQDSEDQWFFNPNGVSLDSPDAPPYGVKKFTFDRVLNADSTQETAYLEAGRQTVNALLNGFNGTIFAYGQSGSGKTFTMLGPDSVVEAIKEGNDKVPLEVQMMYGIIPRAIGDIFEAMNRIIEAEGSAFELAVNYFEIYNESINDLLSTNPATSKNLKLREMPNGQMVVLGGKTQTVQTFDDIFMALMIGQRSRAVASTNQNDRSSRSHTLFVINFKQTNTDGSQKSGRLNLVDLAGSERIAKTGATGQTLKEAQKINLSLTSLGICIKALTDGSAHVPFRDSKLTFFLKDALGGNSKTTLICTASKQLRHLEESIQTLQFAARAKKIKNKAAANVMQSPKEMQQMIERLKAEVATLKQQLLENGITPSMPGKSLGKASAAAAASASEMSSVLPEITTNSGNITTALDEEETKEPMSAGKRPGDISFNTLLDDSNISFNPDAPDELTKNGSSLIANSQKSAGRVSVNLGPDQEAKPIDKPKKPTKQEQKQILELNMRLIETQERLTQVEVEFQTYKENKQTEIIELKERNEILEMENENFSSVEQLQNQIQVEKYTVAQKQNEIQQAHDQIEQMKDDMRKLKDEHKLELAALQEEVNNAMSKIQVKDLYIVELEGQNDEFQSKIERAGYDVFMQIKNDLFTKDKEQETLANARKFITIYDTFEDEVSILKEKYTQQESEIQNLQKKNQELERLVIELENERRDEGMMYDDQSQTTEMMVAMSDAGDDMSQINNRQSIQSTNIQTRYSLSSKGGPFLSTSEVKGSNSDETQQKSKNQLELVAENTGDDDMMSSIKKIEQNEKSGNEGGGLKTDRSRPNTNLNLQKASGNSAAFHGRLDGAGLTDRSKKDSVQFHDSEDDDDTEFRKVDNGFDTHQQTRLRESEQLSKLTQQIMELIVDNIQLVHMNSKIITFCKQQTQHADKVKSNLMQEKDQHAKTSNQNEEQLVELQSQLEDLRQEKLKLDQLLLKEREQFSITVKTEKTQSKNNLAEVRNKLSLLQQEKLELKSQHRNELMQKMQEIARLNDKVKDLQSVGAELGTKLVEAERKLKEQADQTNLSQSVTLMNTFVNAQQNNSKFSMKSGMSMPGIGGQRVISSKVNFNTGRFNMKQLNTSGQSDAMKLSNRNSTSGLNRDSGRLQKRQSVIGGLGKDAKAFLGSAVKTQSSVSGIGDSVHEEDLAEDLKSDEDSVKDYGAEAIDDLAQLEQDLEASDISEDNNNDENY